MTARSPRGPRTGRLGLTASRTELDAAEKRRSSALHGCRHLEDLQPRRRATVAGTVAALTYQPKGEIPSLRARLSDGTGTVELVFLGRRDVPGITPGRRLVAEGMVYDDAGRLTVFNPAYRLLPPESEVAR